MPYLYEQLTGKLFRNGVLLGVGYSGHGDGKNAPAFQYVHNMGPLPVGKYTFGTPFDSPDHGPLAIPILPDKDTETRGRDGFLLHGDSKKAPGSASLGCVIQSRDVRQKVASNLAVDKELEVVDQIRETDSVA